MPLERIQLRPGVNREGTTYSNEGGYYACDKIRFRSGFPESIGGWNILSTNTFQGVARALINWNSLAGENYVGIGTHLKYYIEKGGEYYDVTPLVSTVVHAANIITTSYSTLNGGITATATLLVLNASASFPPSGVINIGSEKIYYASNTSNTLSVLTRGYGGTTAATHANADPVGGYTVQVVYAGTTPGDNDFVTFSGAVAVGGISATALNTEHQVTRTVSAYYTVTTTEFATSQVTGGGGTITAAYQIPTGLETYVIGVGWGAGVYSRGGYGSAATIGVAQQLRLWTHDNYGEDLITAPRGGAIYFWDATGGVTSRAVLLSAAATAAGYAGTFVPLLTNQLMISGVSRFVVALGANSYDPLDANTPFDPLVVRWSGQEDLFQWVPSIINQAGERRISHGSQIISGVVTRQEILIWTDTSLFSMQYIGPPDVFGFDQLADNTSIMSPQAHATVNNVTYWMGVDKFYTYTGRVETLPCTLRQLVFSDINKEQSYQTVCGTNEGFNEVWWFYCSASSTTVDRYVVFNHLERIWYYGTMARTAWLDSPLRAWPMAVDANKRILYHENGVDDGSTTTPAAINSYIESSDFDIGDGHNFGFVWRMLPDINFTGSDANATLPPQVTLTIEPRRNSGSAYGTADSPTVTRTATYPIEQYTGQVYTRLRGRQMALKVESNRIGTRWQMGSVRVDVRPDGRR